LRKKIFILKSFFVIVLMAAVVPSHAWLLYHKPAFKGQLLYPETSKPLEGVAVVVVYEKRVYGPAGSGTEPFDVREAVTDNNGIFFVPSYTTVISPFSTGGECVRFVFYKPGHSSGFWPASLLSYYVGVGCDEKERFFSENFGKEGELLLDPHPDKPVAEWGGERPHKVIFGIAKLPKLKTREERRKALAVHVDPEFLHKTPMLKQLLAEEEKYLGIGIR